MDLVQTVRKEGSRGGRAEFKWEDVKNDTQRENYLGHSLMAPVGRWQQGRDLNWYAKGDAEGKEAEAARIKEEKRKLKEAEEDAMLAAMGLPVPVRNNANLTPLGERAQEADIKDAMEEKAKEREDEDNKAGRRDRREKSGRHRDEDRERKRRHRSRDRSRSRDRRRTNDTHGRRRHRSRSRDHKRRHDRPERPRERDQGSQPSPPRSRDHRRRRDSRISKTLRKGQDGEVLGNDLTNVLTHNPHDVFSRVYNRQTTQVNQSPSPPTPQPPPSQTSY
ncbi:kinase phosphorylation protein-domain-containing protein [Phaeosphaeriaceae sp. PMI808]|nr:kinase phosphorylation protein-domain-containing protein [Phaeosphaeriaceae sp. PMI808]